MRRTLIAASSLLLLFASNVPTRFAATTSRPVEATQPTAAQRSTARDGSNQESPYAAGEIIVKLKPAARVSSLIDDDAESHVSGLISRICGENCTQSVKPLLRQTARLKAPTAVAHGIDRTFVLKLSPGLDVKSAISRLESSGEVEYAEPNRLVKLGGLRPNDPQFQWQWALLNWGNPIDGFDPTPGADIHAEDAWAITTGSPDVLVAVVDTGVDIDHPDLAANIYTNPGEIPGNGIDDDHNGYIDDVHGFNVADHNGDVSDVVGHGTEISGIIAGVLNNHIGISGVCQCKILPVKFFKKTGPNSFDIQGTVADAAAGIVYSIAAGANIINASWTTLLAPGDVSPDDSRALRDACAAARDADILMVCIAGNDGFDLDYSSIYPAAFQMSNQIVTAVSDYNDEIWHVPGAPYEIRTGFGPSSVHLAAPGISITTIQARGTCTLCTGSTNPDDWYTTIDGSSASAGFVSGVAALVKSRFPEANGPVLRQRILAGVDVLDALKPYVITSGRLSAYGALTAQLTVTPPVLKKLKYKAGSGTLLLIGEGFQRGAFAVIGGTRYPATLTDSSQTRLTAKVPSTALPESVSVAVTVLNPDGGISPEVDITR